jgi:hypothetical protein
VQFTNYSKYGKTFNWVFSTADTSLSSTSENPLLTVSGPLKLFVKLTVVSNDGCSKFRQDSIEVFAVGMNNPFAETIKLQAMPNPTSAALQLSFELKKSSNVAISIMNLLGQTTSYNTYDLSNGAQQVNLDLSTLKNGIYIIQLQTPEGVAQLKVMKE